MGTIETNLYPEKSETEGNKVLAEFMGIRSYEDDRYGTMWPRPSGKLGFGLRYNESWSWIIPVWIKFRDLKVDDFDYIDHSDCVDHLKDLLFRADSPSDFFHHLVEAGKWYNQTKTK